MDEMKLSQNRLIGRRSKIHAGLLDTELVK